MNNNSERLVKNERINSLTALLRAIKFRKRDDNRNTGMQQHFAQPQPRARQQATNAEESSWVPSAN